MLLPLDWLGKFVTVNEAADKIAERFVSLGFEAEVLSDSVIDLDITPNRGDVLSILGLAREYAASTKQILKMPELASTNFKDSAEFKIEADPKVYHRLAATLIAGINKQSPAWLRESLASVGMNSINLVVDLTNYVMIELGIPLHAFDFDRLPSKDLKLRLSSEGEEFTSLKDERVKLPINSLVVESGGELIDLLGIRGGKQAMVDLESRNFLIWAVSVPRPLIRSTVKAIGIRTEGAYRHERETDWSMVPIAIARIIWLLKEEGFNDASASLEMTAGEQRAKRIKFDLAFANQLLGTNYSQSTVKDALVSLGFEVDDEVVTVPSWRYFDINGQEDLVEEVARLVGYNQLPKKVISREARKDETVYSKTQNLADELRSKGFTEAYSESFSGRQETILYGLDQTLLATLANPVNREFSYTRPSIIPNLVKILALNSWSDDVKLFEIGNVFSTREIETTNLALVAYGGQQQLFASWLPAGAIKLIGPDDPIAKHYKLRRSVTVGETKIDGLIDRYEAKYITNPKKVTYRKVSNYPPAVRDLSIVVDKKFRPGQIKSAIYQLLPDHVILVELFDSYISERFGEQNQSLAFHIIYQDLNGSLQNSKVDVMHQSIIDLIKIVFGAKVR